VSYTRTGGLSAPVTAIVSIVADPALPRVASLINELNALEKDTEGGRGVGLQAIVPPLEAYVYYKKNPVVASLIVGLIVGLPLFIAFKAGSK